MSTLFQLREEEAEINRFIEEWAETHEGDLSGIADEIDSRLRNNEEALEEKVRAYVGLIKAKERDSRLRSEDAKALASLAKADENTMEMLKDRLRWYMDETGHTKIDLVNNIVSTQANGGKLPLEISANAPTPDKVPDEFRVVLYGYDNEAIRAAAEKDSEVLAKVNEWMEELHNDGFRDVFAEETEQIFTPLTHEDLKGYLKVPWASLGERGRQLRIR